MFHYFPKFFDQSPFVNDYLRNRTTLKDTWSIFSLSFPFIFSPFKLIALKKGIAIYLCKGEERVTIIRARQSIARMSNRAATSPLWLLIT